MQDPLFSSQQKIALYSERISKKNGEDGLTVRSFINDFVSRNLGNYLLIHKEVSVVIEKKIKQAYKLRQEINEIKNKNKISKATSVYNENLRDCRVHYGARTTKELTPTSTRPAFSLRRASLQAVLSRRRVIQSTRQYSASVASQRTVIEAVRRKSLKT